MLWEIMVSWKNGVPGKLVFQESWCSRGNGVQEMVVSRKNGVLGDTSAPGDRESR